MSVISQKIIEVRNTFGLTQAQLAEKAGITQAAIAQYESGKRKPTGEILSRLCNITGLDITWFAEDNELEPGVKDAIALTGMIRLLPFYLENNTTIFEIVGLVQSNRDFFEAKPREPCLHSALLKLKKLVADQ